MRFFKPKIKNKRKRPRKHQRLASLVLKKGLSVTSERVVEWSNEHRQNQTPAEKRYSEILMEIKARQSFRSQQPLYGYIVDFYAPDYMLAVEIDGGYHNSPEQIVYDEKRNRKLNYKGIAVLRFTNEEVLSDPQKVMSITQDKIRSCCIVNKIKHRARHKNLGWRGSHGQHGWPHYNPDPTFPTDAFEVNSGKHKPEKKNVGTSVILRRNGIVVNGEARA